LETLTGDLTDKYLSDTVLFEGSVRDGFGIDHVELTTGGQKQTSTSSSWSFFVNTRTFKADTDGVIDVGGSVFKVPIALVATDKAGNVSSTIVSPSTPATAGYFYVDQSRAAPLITCSRTGFFEHSYGSGLTTILDPGALLDFTISDAECIDVSSIVITISDPSHQVADFVYSKANGELNVERTQGEGDVYLQAKATFQLPEAIELAPKGLGEYALSITASDDIDYKYDPKSVAIREYSDISLTISNAIPTVYVTSPVNGAIVQNLSMTGTVEDGVGVHSVLVSIDGATGVPAALASSGAGVVSTTWTFSSTSLTEGSHTIDVYGYNVGGKQSAMVQRQIVIDQTGPSITVTTPEASSWQSTTPLTIRGGVEDNAGVQAVYYLATAAGEDHSGDTPAVIQAAPWTQATGTGSWSGTLDLSSLGEGSKQLWVAAQDKAGNWSTPTATAFAIDLSAPRATLNMTGTFVEVAMLQSTRLPFTLSGTADDAGFTTGRAAASAVLSYTKDGGAATTVTLTPAADGSWSWSSSSANLTDGTKDGLYVFTLTVTDVAAKTSTVQQIIRIDTTAPTLVVSAPVASEITNNSSYAISGTSRDTGGVGFDGTQDVEYQFSTEGSTWHALALTGTNWGSTIDLGAAEGARTLNFRSTDAVGNVTTSSVTFYYDLASPTIAETTVGTTDTVYRSTNFSFGGTWTETNNLSTIVLSYQKDGGATSTTLTTLTPGSSGTAVAWSASIDVDTDNTGSGDTTGIQDGTYVFTIQATDIAGRSSSLTRTVVIDTTIPIVTPPAPSSDYIATTVTLMGTASDPGLSASGVQAVEYSLDAITWNTADGTTSWSKTVDLSSAAEGDVTVYFRARDKAGLYSASATTAVHVDHNSPRASMSATGSFVSVAMVQSTRIAFTLSGTADDAAFTTGRAAASAVLSYTKDGGAATNVALTPAADGSWSWNSSSANLTDGTRDGLYVFTLTVTDVAAKTSTVQQIIRIDTTAPTLSISTPAPGEATDQVTYAISGTSRDTGGVGFDGTQDVEYQFSTEGSTWHALTLSGINWSQSVNLGAGEGSRTLNFRSTDAVGNVASTSVVFYYDLADPTLTETAVGTADTQYRNADLIFSGAASDTNALSSLSISIDNGAPVSITVDADGADNIPGNADDNSWTYTYDADSPTTEGSHSLVFTATDVAGKTTSLTRTVFVDRTTPSISAVTDLSSGWHTASSQSVSGTADDGTGSGVVRVEYSLDGTNYSIFTGTTSFSGIVAFPDGAANDLRIRAVDRAGNTSAPTAGNLTRQTVRVDTIDPAMDVTSPTTSPVVNGSAALAIQLTASDATSGPVTAQAKIGDSNFGAGTVYSAAVSSGTATVNVTDLTGLSDGTQRVYVRVLDAAGRASTPIAVYFIMDNVNPGVTFTSHADGATINKTLNFSGASSDANGIASVTVEVYRFDGSAWGWAVSPSGTASGTTLWSLSSFDSTVISSASATYDSDSGTAGLQLRIRARAVDAAGNQGTVERTFLVDQGADKPVVKLTNLSTIGTPTLKQTTTIYGFIEDDDGVATSLRMKNAAGDAFTTVSLDGQSFSYTVSGVDGDKELYFEIIDAAGTTFTTTGSATDLSPRLYQGPSLYLETPLAFRLDTRNPEIDSDSVDIQISGQSWADYSSSTAIYGGSATGQFMVRFGASDANGIASASVTVTDSASATNTQTATFTGGYWTTVGYLNVTGLANGSATLSMTATDNSGLSATISKTITIDNTAPTFGGISSPVSGAIVNGNVTLNGSCSDTGVGLASVAYQLGINADTDPNSTSWVDLAPASLYTWQLALNVDTYANASYSTYNAGNETWYFPIVFRVADKAGNTTVTSLGSYYLTINPNADRPTVDIVYPAISDSPLGGSVRVYGTAEDDDSVHAVYMRIDVNNNGSYEATDTVTGDFDNNPVTPDTTIDWYNGGLGQLVTGTNNWSQKINTIGEFNPVGASESRTITVQVRALDKDGNTSGSPAAIYGPWVETTIVFDNNTPKIGSTSNLYLYRGPVGSPTETRLYAEGMTISGDWTFGGSIEDETSLQEISIESDPESALSLSTTLTIGTGGSVSGSHPEWVSMQTAYLRYDLQIPISTSGLGSDSGVVKFTINATDNTNKTATTVVTIYFDNKAPFTTLTTTGPIVNSDGFFDIAGSAADVGSAVNRIEIYFVRPYLSGKTPDGVQYLGYNRFYNPATGASSGSSWATANVGITAVDGSVYGTDGSGTATVGTFYYPASTDYIISVDHLGYTEYWDGSVIQNNDGDAFIEKLILSGGRYSWSGSFDSSLMPDGPIQVHYIVYDSAGNRTHYQLDTVIRNNALTVSSVTLGTDLDGSSTVSSSEQITYSSSSWASTGFVFKAVPSTIDIAASGGNGTLRYTLNASNGSDSFQKTGTLRSGGGGALQQISLSAGDFTGFDDGNSTFTIVVYDSMEETEYPDTDSDSTNDSLSTTMGIGAIVDLIDATAPVTVINPFYWTSSTVNSLYGNSTANGHIEITGVVSGTDPDVSGRVKIEGTSYDDQLIRRIYARIDGLTLSASVTADPGTDRFTTASNHGLSVGDIVYFAGTTLPGGISASDPYYVLTVPSGTTFTVASTYSGSTAVDITSTGSGVTATAYRMMASYSSGSWSPVSDTLAANGWDFSVANVSIGQDGHQASWTLNWDSSMISTVAAADVVIRTMVMDKGGNLSSHTLNATGLISTNNVPYYQVDVVPYITSVTTALSSAYPSNPSVIQRSALGYYPVRETESVTLTGFNLNGTSTAITMNGYSVTPSSGSTTSVVFTVPTAAATTLSGPLIATVNSVSSPNNADDNDEEYNKKANGVNNNSLTDDLYFYVWRLNTVVSNTSVRYPSMRVGTDAGQTVGFVYDSGAQYVRMNVGGSDFQVDQSFTQWYDTAVAVDSNGYIYGASQNGDSGGQGITGSDQDMNTGGGGGWANFLFYAWNTAAAPGSNYNTNYGAYSSGSKKVALENAYNGTTFNSNRVLQPKIAVGSTGVYMTYYDSTYNQLRFRWGTVTGTYPTPTFGGTGGALVSHNNTNNGSGANYQVIAGTGATGTSTALGTTNVSRVGRYSAVGVTSTGVAVIAWYDSDNQTLLYSYNTAPTSTANAANWGTNTIAIDTNFAGWYVDLVVDSSNGIHIAYYNSSSGDLKYAYLPTYSSTPQVCTVDSFLSTGTHISISVYNNGTNQVPYISYYMGAFTQTRYSVRTAWRTDFSSTAPDGVTADVFTGDWEVMTVPTSSVPLEYRIGICIKANGASVNSPILGYGTTAGLETATIK